MTEQGISIQIGEYKFKTSHKSAQIGSTDPNLPFADLNEHDVVALAGFLAVAWENLMGEQYQPVLVTENGYVLDQGIEIDYIDDDDLDLPERDCE